MPSDVTADILIAGTGPAGLVSALLANQADFDTALVGPPVRLDDARTTTLMAPALKVLERLGIDIGFSGEAAPLRTMRIIDGTSRLIRSPMATFRASEIDEPYFGLNIPNRVLNQTLFKAVENTGICRIEAMVADWRPGSEQVLAHLDNGSTASAKLAVAADGRNSPARVAAGLKIHNRPHHQTAFVATFSHERDHGGISTEFHTETGPFTQVPLPGAKSSLVWVVRPGEAENLLAMADDEISLCIENKMQSMLGKITVDGDRQAYPLSTGRPSAFSAKRFALVGEAAHVFPPIGAQGLNLGIRDAVDLMSVAATHRADPGSSQAQAAYERARRVDIMARIGAVNLLNQSLLSGFLPTQMIKAAGMSALSRIAPLRGFFMREGMHPGSGFSGLISSLRKQVGR